MKIFVNESTCIDALRDAVLNKRQAVMLEFSVGLAVFYDQGSAEMHEKKVLRAMYASVDYDCLKRDGQDYVTIDRRISTIAALYNKLGQRTLTKWTKGKTNSEALASIVIELEALYLYTLDSVRQYCRDEPVRQSGPRKPRNVYTLADHPQRRQEDVEYAYVIEKAHIKVGVQPDATYSEIMKTIKELTEIANKVKMDKSHLKAA